MSGRITDASRRRMEAREHFGLLSPVYLDLESRVSKEPRVSISLSGQKSDQRLADEIVEVLEVHFRRNTDFQLVSRKTA